MRLRIQKEMVGGWRGKKIVRKTIDLIRVTMAGARAISEMETFCFDERRIFIIIFVYCRFFIHHVAANEFPSVGH